MKINTKLIPLALLFGAGGGFVLYHAFRTGNPVFFFFSAILFGVGFASLQRR